MKILLVEDNEDIINGLKYSLQKEAYQLISITNIKDTLHYLSSNTPDLIILDITLPDGNGLNIYKKTLKDLKIPTIFLSARDNEDEIVSALNTGAEDYITKPFSTKELLARINKIIIRTNKMNILKVKDIIFDLDKMIIYKNNLKIDLSSLEIKILQLLFLNINKVVSRDVIIENLWEWTGNDVDDHTITVYINRIRKKLGEDIIITVKGIGYRIDEE